MSRHEMGKVKISFAPLISEKMDFKRRFVIQTLMKPFLIVELKILIEPTDYM